MKDLKITLFITTIFFLISANFNTYAKDCSEVKKLHKKLLCKADLNKGKKADGESINEKYNSLADI